MRGEVKVRNRQLRSVQSASFHFAYSTSLTGSEEWTWRSALANIVDAAKLMDGESYHLAFQRD
jgi:hypothetical protein